MHILVVEDDKKVAAFIQKGLQQEAYAADVVYDGETALSYILADRYDLIILDLMLPRLSGLEVLCRIRREKLPLLVLVLSAKGDVEDRVLGLDSGADDYLVKPFAYAELSARIRVLLRRGIQEESLLKVADLELDTITRMVRRGGRKIELTPKEYALLEYLMRNARRPITRNMILDRVWDVRFDGISNVVDVHINWLRKKIDKGCAVSLIHTVRGVGYLLSDESS